MDHPARGRPKPIRDPRSAIRGSTDLMRHRVQDILLVSSLYDWFILSSDGELDELILAEFVELNLRQAPSLTHVSTGAEALGRIDAGARFDLVITSLAIRDMDAATLASRIRGGGRDIPVIALAYDAQELAQFTRRTAGPAIDRAFLWQGDARLLLAIVNYVEDRLNVAADTGEQGVQAVILIEDSARQYSSLLPAIHSELAHQSQAVAPEGVNRSQQLMRAHARPKVLLCTTFEEAWQYFTAYQENILGVISDIEFPLGGRLVADAGAGFARRVREVQPDVPVMLQSGNPDTAAVAREVGASFLLKDSPLLLQDLRRFMTEHFGFGDFVFRRVDGTEVGRARDLKALEAALRLVPAESVAYHAERNHFSTWLKARTEFALAHRLRPRKVSDFATVEDLRAHVVDEISEYLAHRNRSIVADFGWQTFDGSATFSRIGGGSLGGKARGLAFVNLLLEEHGIRDRYPGICVQVPHAVVVGTDVFDEFLDANDLRDVGVHGTDDEIARRFQAAPLPAALARDLSAFLDRVPYPLAVRSSSLLEDSQYQPFAGVYETYMVPNNCWASDLRLGQLVAAIARVYASTFNARAKAYLQGTPFRLEEEKMAVILQRVVGAVHGSRFYPDVSGVARSHNFYPLAPASAEDGVAAVALGLGTTVVDGEPCVRFCPKYPRHLVQFSSIGDAVRNSQREFSAIALDGADGAPALARFGLEAAEADGTLFHVGSTHSPENDALYDGISRPGIRLVSFAPILKSRLFPLPDIITELLDVSVAGASTEVEIEFAVDLSTGARPQEFGVVQLRPVARSGERLHLELAAVDRGDVICESPSVLGHGRLAGLTDAVVVDVHRFDRGRSQDVARDVARFNGEIRRLGRRYVLIGVGRWGSREPLLGIPVSWDQIAAARVIVEAGFRDFRVAPSQGTHFFQNLTATGTGYFTVNAEAGEGFVDWDWLASQPAAAATDYVRWLHFDRPLVVEINGSQHRGVIVKPGR